MASSMTCTDLKEARFGIQKARLTKYVFEYKNVWDPVHKRSKPLYRTSVGKILGDQVIINQEYLALHPELKQGDIVLVDGRPVYKASALALKEVFSFKSIDHFVLTTSQPQQMLDFYQKLGFETKPDGERFVISCPSFKINLHVQGHELEPKANLAEPGTGDFCLEIDTGVSMKELADLISGKGLDIVEGPVKRTGVRGAMTSIYLRDPDMNLVEISSYKEQQ